MSRTAEQVVEAALALPAAERAEVIARLQDSMDGFASPELAAEWDAEIEYRIQEADGGGLPSVSAEEVDRRLREKYGFLTD